MDSMDSMDSLRYRFCNGMLFYPVIRYDLIDKDTYKTSDDKSSRIQRVINLFSGLKYLFFRKKDFLYFTSTLFNFKTGSKFFNVLDDYYFNCSSYRSFIFENPDKNFHFRGPKENRNVSSFFFYLDLIAVLLSHFNIGIGKRSNCDIDDFILLLKEKGFSQVKIDQIRASLIYNEKTIKLRERFYRYFSIYVKPKLIFVNCGSYGGTNAIIIKVAKSLGIKVAEIQHGLVSLLAVPYNYGPGIVNNAEYQKYLPDYLLTFGEYWGTQMRNSCEKVIVGHPHLNKILHVNSNHTAEKNSLLVVSQPTVTDELINAVVALMAKSRGLKVYYRTHPVEELNDDQKTLLKGAGVVINNSGSDLYLDFLKREFIFGCYSLSLVEACAFKKRIFILENDLSKKYIPAGVGIWVKSGNDLASKLYDSCSEIESEKYWSSNFEQHFKAFLSRVDDL